MTQALPEGWEVVRLKDLVSSNGIMTDGDWVESKDQDPRGSVRLIQLADIADGKFQSKSSRFLTPEKAEELRCSYLRPGDLLIARMPDPLGRACIFPGDARAAVTVVDVCIFRAGTKEVSHEWLMNCINSPRVRGVILARASGTTRQRVSGGNLKELEVRIPPAAEQRRIVEKIEALTARSGRAREALAALPALLDRYRAAVLAAAFRGDLTAEWREEHPHAQTADKFLARLGVPVEDIDADEVPLTLPPTWRWARIASLTEVKGGLAKGKKRKATDRLEMIPYLRVANVQRGYLDLTQVKEIEATPEEIAPLLLQPGDILFNEGGDRDKLGRGWVWNGEVERCIHQNHVFRARPISVEINPYLISHFANTYGQRYFFGEGKQSVNLASISLSKLRAFPVPVIPPAEQVVLMQRLQQAFLHVDAFEAAWRAASNRLPTLDSAILAKAFRGELVPQDPTDEPASALLERIRAARAAVGDRPRGGRRWKEPA